VEYIASLLINDESAGRWNAPISGAQIHARAADDKSSSRDPLKTTHQAAD